MAPDQKPKFAFAAGVVLLTAGAVLRLSGRLLAITDGFFHEWLEQAHTDIALVLLALGAAVVVVTFHHWLRRD